MFALLVLLACSRSDDTEDTGGDGVTADGAETDPGVEEAQSCRTGEDLGDGTTGMVGALNGKGSANGALIDGGTLDATVHWTAGDGSDEGWTRESVTITQGTMTYTAFQVDAPNSQDINGAMSAADACRGFYHPPPAPS